jgi:hypothetical protein
MAGTASIRIDQLANPTTPIGQPGRARDDLLLALPVTLRNSDDTDVVRWLWTLLDAPLGSTAVLSSTTSPQVTFTPDVEGSYLVRLQVNDGVTGQIDAKVAAVRTSLGLRYPATGETASSVNWPGNDEKGWGKDAEQVLRSRAVPQLLEGTGLASVPAAVASTPVLIVGLGMPTNIAQIVDYGFVANGPIGGAPTVSGWTFVSVAGTNGKVLTGLTADIDTTACLAGDEWELVVGVADVGDVLMLRVAIV